MARILIMRGIPGAGKTTWVMKNHPHARVCSADSFFIDENGEYRFDGSLLSQAHASCLREFTDTVRDLDAGDESAVVIVDNTAVRAWEISPYYNLASAYGHDVRIVHIHCDIDTAHSRNVHGVPRERIEAMEMSLREEELPPFWKLETVPAAED